MPKQNGSDNPLKNRKPAPPRDRAGRAESLKGWTELGDFFVSFGYVLRGGKRHMQTRVYYSQGDLFMAWEDIIKEELLEWIFEQAATFLPASELKRLKIESPDHPSLEPEASRLGLHSQVDADLHRSVDLEIVDLHLAEVSVPAGVGLQAAPLLRLSGRLRLYHSRPQEHSNGGGNFRVDFWLVEKESGRITPVGSQDGQFDADEPFYDLQVDFPAPRVGRYFVKAAVTLLSSGNVAAEAEGPSLKVE